MLHQIKYTIINKETLKLVQLLFIRFVKIKEVSTIASMQTLIMTKGLYFQTPFTLLNPCIIRGDYRNGTWTSGRNNGNGNKVFLRFILIYSIFTSLPHQYVDDSSYIHTITLFFNSYATFALSLCFVNRLWKTCMVKVSLYVPRTK